MFKNRKFRLIRESLAEHKLLVASTMTAGIILNIFIVLIPISIGKFYELALGMHSHKAGVLDLLPFNLWKNSEEFIFFFIGLILLRIGFNFAERYLTRLIGEGFIKDVRDKLFFHHMHIPLSTYKQSGVSKYLYRFSGDLTSLQNYITKGIIRFSSDIFLLIMAMGILWFLNPNLWKPSIFYFTVVIALFGILNIILKRISRKRRNQKSILLSFVNQRLQAISTVKGLNRISVEVNKFNKKSRGVYEIGKTYFLFYSLMQAIIPAILYGYIVIIMLMVLSSQASTGITAQSGPVMTSVLLIIYIGSVFRRVLRTPVIWELGNISFEKLFKILDLDLMQENNNSNSIGRIHSISISYNQAILNKVRISEIAQPINQICRRGEFIEIEAEDPASLTDSLLGLENNHSVNWELNNQPLSKFSNRSVLKKISIVSDRLPLLGNTVFEVISYSRKKEKRAKAEKVLEILQTNLSDEQKLGLDDKIKDHGRNITSIQKELLLYTRAFLSGKQILVIEAPLNHIQAVLFENIQHYIDNYRQNKCLIILKKKDLKTLHFSDDRESEKIFRIGASAI